jgi:hypothetical protein
MLKCTILCPPSFDTSPLAHYTNFLFLKYSLSPDLVVRRCLHQMGDTTSLSESLDFDQTTANFLAWFAAASGTRLNPKVQLQDLRAQNAGRGAGKLAPTEILAMY